MKKVIIFFALILILSFSVNAISIDVKHSSLPKVQAGAESSINITITNNDYRKEIIDIKTESFENLPSSMFSYLILDKSRVELSSGESKVVNLKFKIKQDVKTNENYLTHLIFTSPSDDSFLLEHRIIIRVVPPEDILDMELSFPDKVEPGRDYELKVLLKNNLNTQIKNARLIVSSDLFNEELGLKFYALQDIEQKFKFPISALTKPGTYNVEVKVLYNNEIIERSTFTFVVTENKDVKEKKTENLGLIIKTYSVEKTNYGNTKVSESYSINLNKFQQLFATYSEQPSSVKGNKVSWVFDIEPNKSHTVSVKVSYVPLVIVLVVLVIIMIVLYVWSSRKLSVTKEILKLREDKDGITELKVLLHIKNKTKKTLRHLSVIEHLPKILEPMKDFGTLKPERVQKGSKGYRVIWLIPELVSGEERIISYNVRSKINIVGSFVLSPTIVRYKGLRGKKLEFESNEVKFSVGKFQ
ncbi:hypothetical protein D6777_03030 [Candidatus Woesearchaeota archaeon]|nr:MAG: hypothetical protein D6777_03030 [Candidatus Woesearchaeota archaeon]